MFYEEAHDKVKVRTMQAIDHKTLRLERLLYAQMSFPSFVITSVHPRPPSPPYTFYAFANSWMQTNINL